MTIKIDAKEIMTIREMTERYSDKWFSFEPVGLIDLSDVLSSEGRIMYIADTEEELLSIPDTSGTILTSGANLHNSVIHMVAT